MPKNEHVDDVFLALGKFVRIRGRSAAAMAKTSDGGAETAAKRALFVLRHGPIRASELAAAMSADPSTTSRHVAALVEDGLVRREPDPADRRAALLDLTEAGVARVAELEAHRRELIGALVADWSDEEFGVFAELLKRFVDAADAHLRTDDPRGDSR